MRILLLGGTGAMGAPLIDLLSDEKNEVYITSRREHNSIGNIKYFVGNAHDNSFLDKILDLNYDVIVDFMSYKSAEFLQRVDKLLASTGQYIFISSSRVYSNYEGFITENSPRLLDVCQQKEYLSSDEYALTKARQEDILYHAKRKNWTIIRPYITYNNERLQLGIYEKEFWLYRVLHNRTVVFPKDMANCFTTLTYGVDVAKVIVQLIGKQEAMSETFHITSAQNVRWEEVISIYSDIIKVKTNLAMKVKYVDNSEIISKVFFSQRWQIRYDRLYDRRFNNKKIEKMTNDIMEFKELRIGLEKCIEWFIENKDSFKPLKPVGQAYMDRICKECTSLDEFKDKKSKIQYVCIRYVPMPIKFFILIYSNLIKLKVQMSKMMGGDNR